jgi:L-aspartate oxidase
LASNSLLEGLVFGARAGSAAATDDPDHSLTGAHHEGVEDEREASSTAVRVSGDVAIAVKKRVRRLMWERVGILRSRESIKRALFEFEQIARAPLARASRNFLNVATLIARSALWREESRGAHFRTDYPQRDDEHWRVHSISRAGADISSSAQLDFKEVMSNE